MASLNLTQFFNADYCQQWPTVIMNNQHADYQAAMLMCFERLNWFMTLPAEQSTTIDQWPRQNELVAMVQQ